MGIFLLLSSVMMLNLLIALLGNVYSVLAERVDGEYNVNIINLYNIWSWDDRYGFLIFFTSPLSYISLILSSPLLFLQNKRRYNFKISRAYYAVIAFAFYIQLLIYQFFYLLPVYIKGFVITSKQSG